MSYHSKNPRFNSVIFKDEGSSGTPDSPASGSHKLVDRNGKFFVKNSAGTEDPLGSGAGEINVISDPNTASQWATSNVAQITVATSTTASDLPLGGVIPTAVKITPISSTAYVYTRWTMPAGLKNRKLKVEFFQRALSGYASGDLKLEVYKNSASDYSGSYTEFNLSTDSSGTTALPNATGKFTTTFDTDDGDYYELRIVRVAGTTAFNIASLIVGPGVQPQGAVVGAPISYTPTGAWSANTTYSGFYYSVGQFMVGHIDIVLSGIPTNATLSINYLPAGHTLDASVLSASGVEKIVGKADLRDSGTRSYPAVVALDSATTLIINHAETTGSTASRVDQDSPFAWNTDDSISLDFVVPIAEWAGRGALNIVQNDQEFAYSSGTWDADNTTNFAYGPEGQAMGGALADTREKRVRFQRPMQPRDLILIEFSNDRNAWYPAIGGKLNGVLVIPGVSAAGTVIAGVNWESVNSTDIDVQFGRYIAMANDDAPTFDWPSSNAYWRVRKISGGAAMVEEATTSSLGLVKKNRYRKFYVASDGTTTGDLTLDDAIDFLDTGKLYEFTAVLRVGITDMENASNEVVVRARHNGADLARAVYTNRYNDPDTASTKESAGNLVLHGIFTAAAASLTFNVESITTGVVVSGATASYIYLKELNDTVSDTTDW